MFKAFAGREDGFALVFFGITLLPLLGFLGLSFDLGRGWLVHDKMATAAQAAAIYAVERTNDSGVIAGARSVFAANLPEAAHGASYDPPTVAVDDAAGFAEVRVRGRVHTLFMRYLGYDEIDVAAEARARRIGTEPDLSYRLVP